MTGNEVRKMTDEEMAAELTVLRRKLVQLRAQAVTEKVEDNSLYGRTRRDIARILTERHARVAPKR
ncbi:MAG: 50S ribosomal protein L29 [Phycisphaerae bacterium]|nr:50S ribosomal protein L29 [Phycisphaerae bacterium]